MGGVPPPELVQWLVGNTKQCKWCGSLDLARFTGEVGLHFPGLKNIEKPPVFVFPQFAVCAVCGAAWFALPEAELRLLVAKRDVPSS
jgi:hypothetical protein